MSRSVSNPDFKYTPSHNIYWEKLMHLPKEMDGLAFTDEQTEACPGNLRNHFLSTHELPKSETAKLTLHVEVGCNAGHVCLEWAKQNSDSLYIGIDWKFKQIYRLAEKSAKAKVKNLLAFRANAERLPFIFAPKEIDFLYLFFPDPWSKKAQQKNRTASIEWLTRVAPLLSGKGYFHIKTDHALYYEFIRENISKLSHLYEVIEETADLHAGNGKAHLLQIPEVTLFEKLFIKDGLPIHSVKFRKIDNLK